MPPDTTFLQLSCSRFWWTPVKMHGVDPCWSTTHTQSMSSMSEKIAFTVVHRIHLAFKSIATLLFAFHDYIKNVPTTFAKDFNSCSLADSKTHFSTWALKASHSSRRKSKHNGHDGKNKRVVSSLEWMLNAGRRAKCQTCRAVESSPIYIELKSSQSIRIGQIFLVNDNLFPGEATTAQRLITLHFIQSGQ